MSAAPDLALRFEAARTITHFQRSDARVRCLMGPVGSGKSSACVLELLLRSQKQEKGPDGIRRTRWAVIRNTYGQLRDTTRKTFEHWVPHQVRTWKEQEFVCRLRFEDVESEVLFRALDRPEDVAKLLSLELTGAFVNEAREIPKHVLDVLQTRIGRYPSRLQGGPTWSGIWMDTNPWHGTHWGAKLFNSEDTQVKEHFKLWHQPGGRSEFAENLENLPARYYDDLCIGKDSEWIKVYVDGKEATSDVGSVYGELLDTVQARGGTLAFEHPTDGIFTSWDLGFTDSTAVWFWRVKDDGVDFVGFYKASGKPISHFFDLLETTAQDMGFMYVKHWLPHDAASRTLASQQSILDHFLERYGTDKVAIGPRLSLLDGIQAGRWLLERPGTRFHPRCAQGLEDLREYRYEWDEDARCFSRKPLHNWASHTADAFRYTGVVVRVARLLIQKPVVPKLEPIVSKGVTLEDLWAARENVDPYSRTA
jgi:phage terminase large subunit